MATTIITRHEDGDVNDAPITLAEGELAVNTQAAKLWVGPIGGGTPVPLVDGAAVPNTTQIIAGTGLTGGGALTSDVTLSADPAYVDSKYLRSDADDTMFGALTLFTTCFAANGVEAQPGYTFTNSQGAGMWHAGLNNLAFSTVSQERLRIDELGNVSIGTNSAWARLHIEGRDGLLNNPTFRQTDETVLVENDADCILTMATNATGSDCYIKFAKNGAADSFGGVVGYAASGSVALTTAGNTDALVVSSAGNVGIGTTVPNNQAGYGLLNINGTTGAIVDLSTADGGNATRFQSDATDLSLFAGKSAGLNKNTRFYSSGNTERMRITSTGNVGIGETNPLVPLVVVTSASGEVAQFTRSGNNNALITIAGIAGSTYLGSGNTSGYIEHTGNFEYYADAAAGTHTWFNNSAAYTQRMLLDGTGQLFIPQLGGTQVNLEVGTGGLLIRSASDARLKMNRTPLTYGLEAVGAMQPVSFNFKPETNRGDKVHLGFIAQEMLEVVPELVGEGDDGFLSINYSEVTAVLVKAIQELTARLEALES